MRARNDRSSTTLPVKKGNKEWVYYDVYLSPSAVKLITDYFQAFPEIILYMKENVHRWEKKFALPRMHDV